MMPPSIRRKKDKIRQGKRSFDVPAIWSERRCKSRSRCLARIGRNDAASLKWSGLAQSICSQLPINKRTSSDTTGMAVICLAQAGCDGVEEEGP